MSYSPCPRAKTGALCWLLGQVEATWKSDLEAFDSAVSVHWAFDRTVKEKNIVNIHLCCFTFFIFLFHWHWISSPPRHHSLHLVLMSPSWTDTACEMFEASAKPSLFNASSNCLTLCFWYAASTAAHYNTANNLVNIRTEAVDFNISLCGNFCLFFSLLTLKASENQTNYWLLVVLEMALHEVERCQKMTVFTLWDEGRSLTRQFIYI